MKLTECKKIADRIQETVDNRQTDIQQKADCRHTYIRLHTDIHYMTDRQQITEIRQKYN